MNRFGALPVRTRVRRLYVAEVVSHGSAPQANDTEASPRASITATPRSLSR